jgi:DNA repair protein SbcD/Mre11
MRVLHSADWHAGKMLRNRSRADELESVLGEIIDISRRERIDVVIVAGDVFDAYAPSAEAERLVFSALAELVGSKIPTIIIAGNHDHPKRLAAIREIVAPLQIFVRSEPQRPETGGIIEVRTRNEAARIAVLPWVPDHKMVDICQLMQPDDTWYSTYSENVSAMCQQLAQSFSISTVNIMVAHLYAFGASTSGSERAIHVSQPFAISPATFPVSAQYIALGHLHRPQEVACATRCCYSGSPLQLDFGERDQQKSVVIADIKAGHPALLEQIPLSSGRKLRDIVGTMQELTVIAGSLGDEFLRVTVKTDQRIPGIADQIRDLFPNALHVMQEYPHSSESPSEPIGNRLPWEIFSDFHQQAKGTAPTAELLATFQALYTEATRATD